MTFSIVARGADGKSFGVAVASKFLAVGAAVPAAEAGIGAIATQAYANLAYRADGLAQLRRGRRAQLTLDALVATDDKRESRQAGVVDAAGAAATFTGSECNPWAGGVTGDGYAIQGNILVGPEVVAAMEQTWLGSGPDEPLARRLLAGLTAGDDAGGDSRGRQSAALLVVTPEGGYGGGSDVLVDLRVDDHAAPVAELARLLDLHDLYFAKPDLFGKAPEGNGGRYGGRGSDTAGHARLRRRRPRRRAGGLGGNRELRRTPRGRQDRPAGTGETPRDLSPPPQIPCSTGSLPAATAATSA
jgi:uncharacterized Ntn-hydrolase superfamily protein